MLASPCRSAPGGGIGCTPPAAPPRFDEDLHCGPIRFAICIAARADQLQPEWQMRTCRTERGATLLPRRQVAENAPGLGAQRVNRLPKRRAIAIEADEILDETVGTK